MLTLAWALHGLQLIWVQLLQPPHFGFAQTLSITVWLALTVYGIERQRYPRIEVDPNVLYVDEGQILTSAGSAAGLDLCLHLVRRDFGARIANQVARRLVLAPHRDGGQAQFIDLVEQLPDHTVMLNHPVGVNAIASLAF